MTAPAKKKPVRKPSEIAGVAARQLAAEALLRIERDGAYANIVLSPLLDSSGLEQRDKGFVTELVYGTTRMRRSCDWLVDRFLPDPERVDLVARTWLRLGAFQLAFLGTPPHAAVSATVEAAPKKISGLCNAVLRKVATSLPVVWPSDEVRLSQPDWLVARLSQDLGPERALAALEAMNEAASVTTRDDGYIQDEGSQLVAAAVDAEPGDLILDMCAAPGGKATALVSEGAIVVAADMRQSRLTLLSTNRDRLDISSTDMHIVGADGTSPPFRNNSFDRVLLDAPCSGLGALRRRPDARWRITQNDIDTLVEIQRRLFAQAVELARPGGEVVYSVCTLTSAETLGLDEWVAKAYPNLVARPLEIAPWTPLGRGAILLPQDEGTDGMYILRLRVPADERELKL
ncbi:MAG: transcription antitermination factor NusB [Actinomycetota bacterium]